MIIKVCGMRDAENIRAVEKLGIDMMGFVFRPGDERFVSMIHSRSGIIPDKAREDMQGDEPAAAVCRCGGSIIKRSVMRVGVFADDMPQNIITRVYNYGLDTVQLDGDESAVMIDNLLSSVDPDIHEGLNIIKTINVTCKADFEKCRQYEGHADMLLFRIQSRTADGGTDWSLLDAYKGKMPFLVGNVGAEDAENIENIENRMFVGVDLDREFETVPAVKDVKKLEAFVGQFR